MIEMIACRALELVITTVAVAFSIFAYFRLQEEIEENKINKELLRLKYVRKLCDYMGYECPIVINGYAWNPYKKFEL